MSGNGHGNGHGSGLGSNSTAAEHLRQFIEQLERLEEEKKAIADDITAKFREARAMGFDPKIMRVILRLRKMTGPEREEYETLVELYKAALGMLGGRPLSPPTVKKLSGEEQHELDLNPSSEEAPDAIDELTTPKETAEEAREKGREAARAGKKITENPYPANDERRAAWDEGWCQETGTDGFEIPEAWRRKPKEKKPKDDADSKPNEQPPAPPPAE